MGFCTSNYYFISESFAIDLLNSACAASSIRSLTNGFFLALCPLFYFECLWETSKGTRRGLSAPNRPLRDFFRDSGGETPAGPVRQELQEGLVPLGGLGRLSGNVT